LELQREALIGRILSSVDENSSVELVLPSLRRSAMPRWFAEMVYYLFADEEVRIQ
jgi:hypothetical protein